MAFEVEIFESYFLEDLQLVMLIIDRYLDKNRLYLGRQ